LADIGLQRQRVETGRTGSCRRRRTRRTATRNGIVRASHVTRVGPAVGVPDLIPAVGEPAQHRDAGGGAALGDDRRVDHRAIGSARIRGHADAARRQLRAMVVVPDGYGLDARRAAPGGFPEPAAGRLYRRSTPCTRSPAAAGTLPRRAAAAAEAGAADPTRPDRTGNGGQAAKDAAPAQRSATRAVRGLGFRILFGLPLVMFTYLPLLPA